MKILLLSTSECTGGAAIAANRLMRALNKSGQEAKMLVRDKQTDDPNVVSINTNRWKKTINFIRFAYEQWVIFVHNRFDRKNLFAVSIANTGTDISNHSLVKEADVIHLHWINQGFLSLENIRQLQMLNKPVVWTMHDMWVCSGICHYVASTAYPHIDAVRCNRFVLQCDICPFTPSGLAFQTWRKKKTVFMPQKILFVGCSNWISNMAKSSALLRDFGITSIPNPVDIDVFKPLDSTAVRNKFNLPLNRKLILFAAANLSDKRKGIDYFIESCRMLA
ncbi:MAG: glycosyltransferase, partial [Dysgonamonadaceae bacterium]|nr:glycosyltransferase [Dysgonamonadaceae bacterium]